MTAAPLDPVALDRDGRVASDFACIKCDYNLRSVATDGRCPECGLAVGRSAVGNWLQYCEPDWLQQVWRGLNRLGVALGAAGFLVALEVVGVYSELDTVPYWLLIVATAFLATLAVFAVIGFAIATTPDPAGLHESSLSARRVARYSLIGAIGLGMFGLTVVPWLWRVIAEAIAIMIAFLVVCGLTVGVTALLVHARSLAKRVPSMTLANCTFAQIVGVVSTAIAGASAALLNAFEDLPAVSKSLRYIDQQVFDKISPGINLIEFLAGLVLIATPSLSIVGVILFFCYYAVMSEQAKLARQTWARQPFQKTAKGAN